MGLARPMPMARLRQAAIFPVTEAVVEACLGPAAIDAVFTQGWRTGPASLTRSQRNAVAGVTGHLAESVADKADNPGMTELGLDSADVYGGVVVVNFADLVWRAALTSDFCTLMPISEKAQLTNLGWLR